jgi:poly(hydroxyalkanoate) depolymerase family esterase
MNTPNAEVIAEATRLTRDGRIAEATALLQGALRGQPRHGQPRDGQPSPVRTRAAAAPGRLPRDVIDVDSATGDTIHPTSPVQGRMAAASMQRLLRGVPGGPRGQGPHPGHRAMPHRAPMQAPEPLPEGASFRMHTFANAAGSRSYKLYVPGMRREAASALVVMLHGCTQSPDDFAAGTRMNALAEEHGFLVAYPAQAQAANTQKCWNWFSPGDQRRDGGEPFLIAGITRQVVRDHALDSRRVYVAGLSAGGAAAAILGQAYPDLYAAIGVHSGLACGAAKDVPSAFAAMRQGAAGAPQRRDGAARLVPTIVFHADRDGTVHPRNGDEVLAQGAAASPGLRRKVERGQVPGGHAYSRTRHLDGDGRTMLEQWLVHGGGHAWSGGSPAGTYTDPRGPDASREMVRFFLGHRLEGGA